MGCGFSRVASKATLNIAMTRKYALAILAFAFFLVPNLAFAEQSGAFVGIQAGFGATQKDTQQIIFSSSTNGITAGTGSRRLFEPFGSSHQKAARYGALVGYKHFLRPDFGLRFYLLFDGKFHADDTKENDFKTYNYNLNLDALYNFFTNDSADIGIFAGASLGGVQHKQSSVLASGAEFAINAGLRANVKQHGLELYSRFGFVSVDNYHFRGVDNELVGTYNGSAGWNGNPTTHPNVTYTNNRIHNIKINQPYQVGIRYVYSF